MPNVPIKILATPVPRAIILWMAHALLVPSPVSLVATKEGVANVRPLLRWRAKGVSRNVLLGNKKMNLMLA